MAATTLHRPVWLAAERELPTAADLLGDPGARRIARFLEGRDLDPHRIEPAQAHYRPGRWLTVCYRTASVDRASGGPITLTVTAEHRAGGPVSVWAFPEDPSLPGLATAADRRLVTPRLPASGGVLDVQPLRYRPRRRAVLRYRLSDGTTLFGKVVSPARARHLIAISRALRTTDDRPGGDRTAGGDAGAPAHDQGTDRSPSRRAGSAGAADLRFVLPSRRIAPGALVLPCATGTSLRDLFLAGGPLPDPERLARLPADIHERCHAALAAVPTAADDRGRGGVPPLSSRRRTFDPATALAAAQVVARLLPEEACTAARLAEAVIGCAEASEPPDDWIVHGDLYENQILIDPAGRLSLIDLDDLGPGDPLLDAANFSAHLLLLAASDTPSATMISRYRNDLLDAFYRSLGATPADLA